MEFLVLGSLEVLDRDRLVPLGSAKQRLLLAALLVHANQVVSVDRLADILWGDDQPGDAVATLQTYVSRLRTTLESDRPSGRPPAVLLTRAPGYLLRTGEDQVDAVRFERLLRNAQRGAANEPAAAAALFDEALALWRGPAFAEFAFDPFAQAEAARLDELHLVAIEDRIDTNLALGRHDELVGDLEGIMAAYPLRERPRAQLMLALYRCGRQAEALRAFQDYRTFLGEELGIEPSPALRELETAIVRQEPGLDWTAGPTSRTDGEPGPVRGELPTGWVTFLFTDLEESTRLWEEHPHEMRAGLARHDEILRDAVHASGGHVVKTTGDGIHAVFAEALDAAAAALVAQERLAAEKWGESGPLRVRMGIHVGDAERRDDDYYGPTLNRASRLMAAAHGGQVVLSQAAAEVVCDGLPDGLELLDLGEHRLRGLSRPERVFQLTGAGLRTEYPALMSLDAFPGRVPLPAPAFARGDEHFAGRGAALELLQAAWRHAREGVRQVVLVAGEPGIGKTRLTSELSQRAYAHGSAVLYGRCDEEAVAPYQPFIEALRPYLASCAPSVLHERLQDLASDLVRVFPELVGRIPELTRSAPSPLEGAVVGGLDDTRAADRYRLFEALTTLLNGITMAQPVLLVLDDLHWADKPTVLLLRHLLRAVTHAPLLVVGCYRDVELPRGHPLADLLADLRREPSVTWVALDGLSQTESDDLLRGLAGRPVAAPLAAALHRETGGNPFFLEELLRHLRETDAIPLLEAGLSEGDLGDLDLPDSVRDVVVRRLRRLPSSVNDTLNVAAVVGPEFDTRLLARAAEQPVTDILDALDHATGAGLVAEDPRRTGQYTFSHALIRQALYADLGTARRAQLHRQVGTVMEEEGTGPRTAATLAQHFLRAVPLGEAARAIRYTATAGREAAADFAFEDAVQYFERALELLDEHAPGETTERAQLLIDLADSLLYVDEHAGVEAALRAVDAVRTNGSPLQFGRAVAVLVEPAHAAAAYPREVGELFDEAIALLGEEHPAVRARLLAIMAFKYTTYQLWGRDGRLLAHEALQAARATGDPITLADALLARASSLEGLPDLEERRAVGQELVALGRTAGARPWSYGLFVLAVAQLALGDAEALSATITEQLRVGDQLHWFPAHVHAARWQATQALLEGRFDDVRSAGKEMRRYARAYRSASAMHSAILFHLAREEGQLPNPMPGQPLEAQRKNLHALVMVALAQVDEGDVTAALEELRSLAADRSGAVAGEPAWPAFLSVLTEAAARADDASHANFLVDQLSPFAGQLLTIPTGLAALGAADRFLGMLTTLLERWDDASDHFERALALEERARGWALLPRTRYWQARLLLARGESDDEAEAAAALRQVRNLTARLGMSRLQAQAAALGPV